MVALMVAAVVTVGTGIWLSQRKLARGMATLLSETNEALRALALAKGLELIATAGDQGFVEARGDCSGVRVHASVRPIATDTMSTVLFFPGRPLDAAALRSIEPLVDRAKNEDGGLTLYLGKTPPFWYLLQTLDRLPQNDTTRLVTALEAACARLGGAAGESRGGGP